MASPLLSGRWSDRYTPDLRVRKAVSLRVTAAMKRGDLERERLVHVPNVVLDAREREHPGMAWWTHEQRIREACDQALERWRMTHALRKE